MIFTNQDTHNHIPYKKNSKMLNKKIYMKQNIFFSSKFFFINIVSDNNMFWANIKIIEQQYFGFLKAHVLTFNYSCRAIHLACDFCVLFLRYTMFQSGLLISPQCNIEKKQKRTTHSLHEWECLTICNISTLI